MRKFTLLLAMFFVMSFAVKAATYTIDFENEKKSAYASADVNLGGVDSIKWNLTDVIIAKASMGNADYYEGTGSLRMRGYTTSVATMLANKIGGIGNISFKYKVYGTDSQIPYNIDWSSDGTTWINIGQITANSTVQTFSFDLNQANARIRIIAAGTSTSNKRMNIDNIVMTDNGGLPVSQIPVIIPASGNIYVPTTVTITAGTGASIYYTTNGTEPTNASTPYT
ncbi:MAG TPA: chitobiase/beta-hexosaminidase C-terminal domain-containing protein, partial [Paludibacteraceae bacterium]|nr:chitobiase/beta-hexosaminidase C-terminal domain-containing protein [Paludibacteraceae bacterium]